MKNETAKKAKSKKFSVSLPSDFSFPKDRIGRKLLREYGAMFVAQDVIVPNTIVFKDEAEVSLFQSKAAISKKRIGGFEIELQTAAMKNLQKAIKEAARNNLSITPRGTDAARRNYTETVNLWASRVNPGLEYWIQKGKLSETNAGKIRTLSPFEQVSEIFKFERVGMFFSKDLSKTIIYSVAPPGASQHLALLALDINEHNDAAVREILARNGWFQTVVSDLPHFTFLGVSENELFDLGLKKIVDGERSFWIPNLIESERDKG